MVVDNAIIRQKIDLMITQPFWGSLITRLLLREWDMDTFGTNGKSLCVPAKKYWSKYSPAEILFILAHETWHCAGGHLTRRGNRDPYIWNVACDFATNLLLVKAGFTRPKDGCYDEKYEGMTPEKIYGLLIQQIQQQGGKGQKGSGSGKGKKGEGSSGGDSDGDNPYGIWKDLQEPGEGEKDGDGNKYDPKELEQEWREAVTAAIRHAQSRGRLPSGMEEYIDECLFPKVPWQDLLLHWLQTTKGCNDYTAYPFNRRHIYREIYLPSLQGERIEVILGMDTSGSIGTEDLVRYFSELRGICNVFNDFTIHFIECDADVHNYTIIESDSDVPRIAVGRGGTDFRPFFKKVEELQLEHLPIVYFTDLDGYFPDSWSGDSVFWLIRKSQNRGGRHDEVPFGRIIEIDD